MTHAAARSAATEGQAGRHDSRRAYKALRISAEDSLVSGKLTSETFRCCSSPLTNVTCFLRNMKAPTEAHFGERRRQQTPALTGEKRARDPVGLNNITAHHATATDNPPHALRVNGLDRPCPPKLAPSAYCCCCCCCFAGVPPPSRFCVPPIRPATSATRPSRSRTFVRRESVVPSIQRNEPRCAFKIAAICASGSPPAPSSAPFAPAPGPHAVELGERELSV